MILYQLLAEQLPYRLEGLPLVEAARVVQEQEPRRLGSIHSQWRGDIETLVGRALEKDPVRRYPSAAELAADIRRHLNHEPIRARPPSLAYQLGKFVRRNKVLVGGVAAVLLALLGGLTGTGIYALRETEQHRLAVIKADEANDKRKQALWAAYLGRIAAANAALRDHDVTEAARQLAAAPPSLHDWEWHHLYSLLDGHVAVLRPDTGEKVALVPGPDGLRLAALKDSRLRLLDEDGRECLVFPHPVFGYTRVQRTPRGSRVFTGTPDGTRVWDETGREKHSLPPNLSVCFSPDLTRAALFEPRDQPPNGFRLVDRESGKESGPFIGHGGPIYDLVFSPDSKRIATASEDGTARLWDAATGKETAVLRGHAVKVLCVVFRPDGGRVLTASADGTIRQWDPATGREVEPPYERHTGEVWTAAYSPDGEWVASAGADRTVRLWRATGPKKTIVFQGHTDAVVQLAFTPDGQRLASRGEDGSVRFWNVGSQPGLSALAGHTSYIYPVAWSPDGRWIASGSWDGTVRIWDATTRRTCGVLRHPSRVLALAFAPDGSWLATGCADELVRVWTTATGQRTKEFRAAGRPVYTIAVHPDGTRLAVGDFDGHGAVLDAATGKRIETFRPGLYGQYAYSPNGRLLAAAENSGTIHLLDGRTHERRAELPSATGSITGLTFSPDSRRLVAAGYDHQGRIWDVDTGQCVATLSGHTDDIFAAVFHPNGTRVATAGRDGTIWIWDAATGDEVVRLKGHTNYVWSLAFSPDGATLASGSGDGTVGLWDTESPAHLAAACREAEALAPEADRLVGPLFKEKKGPSEVLSIVQTDPSLRESLRGAALGAILRHCVGEGK